MLSIQKRKIRELIAKGEIRNTNVEFKKCKNGIGQSVYETICAFLNRNGGDILLGVEDDGTVVGVDESAIDNHIKNIINTLNNIEIFNPVIFLTPEIVEIDNKNIIHIKVPESPQVHRFKNKIFDRVSDADNNITNSHHLVENMYLRKNKSSSESNVCPFLTLDELDEVSFKKMRTHISIYTPTHPWIEMSNDEMLHSAGFWRRDPLTNKEGYILAVVLLFGKEQTILNYCPWHRTDAIYRNMSYKRFLNPLPTDPDMRYNDRDMVCVNLIESYVRLMNFIERNMPDVFALDEKGINRLDLRNMLFREIVSNLLLHREYASTFSSKLLIFSDRVITENWTKPVQTGNVTLDTLETYTKNPLITKVFREMKWAEELGSGKKNIKKYAPLYYDKCEIEIQNNEKFLFSITYKEGIDIVESQKEPSKRIQADTTQPLNPSTPQAPHTLRNQEKKVKQKQILDFCRIPRDMKDIMNHLGYKDRKNFRLEHIKPLLEKSLLSMTFPDNPNHQEQKYVTTYIKI